MLSYQHMFHAGNAADVHKHALLAVALDYLTRKDKALSYLDTHAGRGLYDLGAGAAEKTGEARAGVARLLERFDAGHPYRQVIEAVRRDHGAASYPGSPMIARRLLRAFDKLTFAELHPAEHAVLTETITGPNVRVEKRDGLEMAGALTPPEPRRGLMLIDPSWEVRADYDRLAALVPKLHRKWNVGIVMLWYPLLADGRHKPMLRALRDGVPGLMVSEVRFPPAKAGHGMAGSGMAVVNPPWGLEEAAAEIARVFKE